MARKRFKNRTDKLQIIYDEQGVKREIVPNGTIILEENWGKRFSKVLAPVDKKKPSK